MAKSHWHNRLLRDIKGMSNQIRVRRLKMGFYRVYFKDAYVHEVYDNMPPHGYTIEDYDPRLESQQYYEEYEDHVSLVRTVKNFVEGYWDSRGTLQRRIYMLRHSPEMYERSRNAYKQMVIK